MDRNRKDEALQLIGELIDRHPGSKSGRSAETSEYFKRGIGRLIELTEMNLTQMGALLGTTEQAVYRWKYGANLPPKTKLKKMLRVIDDLKEDETVEENLYEQAKVLLEKMLDTYPSGKPGSESPEEMERLKSVMIQVLELFPGKRGNLAAHLKVSQQTIDRWAHGVAAPRRNNIKALLHYVNGKLNVAPVEAVPGAGMAPARFKVYVRALARIDDPHPDDFQLLAQVENVAGPLSEEALAAIVRDRHSAQE